MALTIAPESKIVWYELGLSDGNWCETGSVLGEGSGPLPKGRVRPASSHQQSFHEPPLNLWVESQSVLHATFRKGHSKSFTCWPFCLHVGALWVMQFPPLSRIEKTSFWMEKVTHSIKSISGMGLLGPGESWNVLEGQVSRHSGNLEPGD